MNLSFTPEQIYGRINYLVALKRLSVANARGYDIYVNLDRVHMLWTDIDPTIHDKIADEMVYMFNTWKQYKAIDENYLNSLDKYLPSIWVFNKTISREGKLPIRHWLFHVILPKFEQEGNSYVNVDSYKSVYHSLKDFAAIIQDDGKTTEIENSISIELYNPLIHMGLAPIGRSATAGISFIKGKLQLMFHGLVKVSEASPEHMLALVSEHQFCPKVTYLGSIKDKDKVDNIHIPIMSDIEIAHEQDRRMNIVMKNFPNVTEKDIRRNNVRLFSTIDPLDCLALHYGFVDGDLVELQALIPSGKSTSSRKREIYLVR